MLLILNLDDRFPVPFKSLDIQYSEFIDGYPTNISTDGTFRGCFAVNYFEIK